MDRLTLRRVEPGEWERVRSIRLRALADSPDAFGTTLAEDTARPLREWRARLESPGSATFIATADGRDAGIAFGRSYDEVEGAAGLFGMWVAPEARRTGVAGALVAAVVSWARTEGYARLLLDVADTNLPAVRFYESRGFAPTGTTGTLPPPREHVLEHQRALRL